MTQEDFNAMVLQVIEGKGLNDNMVEMIEDAYLDAFNQGKASIDDLNNNLPMLIKANNKLKND